MEVRGWLVTKSAARALFGFGHVGVVASEGDDPGPEAGVRGEHAVVAVAVDPGRRDQAREGFEKLERREGEEGPAIGGGAGWLIEDPANAPGVGRPRRGGGLERFGVAGSGWRGGPASLATYAWGSATGECRRPCGC